MLVLAVNLFLFLAMPIAFGYTLIEGTKSHFAIEKTSKNNAVKRQKVELYVTSWCGYCKQAQAFFRAKRIPIKVYDIEKDRNAAWRKKKLDGVDGVPFAVINGQKIRGYKPKNYAAALKRVR